MHLRPTLKGQYQLYVGDDQRFIQDSFRNYSITVPEAGVTRSRECYSYRTSSVFISIESATDRFRFHFFFLYHLIIIVSLSRPSSKLRTFRTV